jgi:hypothetical protein
VVPYFLLTAYHEDYNRNKSEVGSNRKINLQNLSSIEAVSVSPVVAAEAAKFTMYFGNRILANLTGQSKGNIIAAGYHEKIN